MFSDFLGKKQLEEGSQSLLVTFPSCTQSGHTNSVGLSEPRAAVSPALVPAAVITATEGAHGQRDFSYPSDSITGWEVRDSEQNSYHVPGA